MTIETGPSDIAIVAPGKHVLVRTGRALTNAGFSCQTFDSAESFLGEVGRWDALVCAVGLPGMCGVELQRRLTTAGSDCPIVLVDIDAATTGRNGWTLGEHTVRIAEPVDAIWLVGHLKSALEPELAMAMD